MFWINKNSVSRFFHKVDKILGIFEEMIEEGRQLIQELESQIKYYENTIRTLEDTKEEISDRIERIKRVLGDS